MSPIKNLEKLWGISTRSAKLLVKSGIKRVEDIREIDVEETARLLHRPAYELEISKSIAKKVNTSFLDEATESKYPLAEKIWGIGLDLALFLYIKGIKDLGDVDEKIITPEMPKRLSQQLSILFPQTQLALIPGLTSKSAQTLVTKLGILSLDNLSTTTPSKISRILRGVSTKQAKAWTELAEKLVKAEILYYKDAKKLPLAKRVKGIGPEIGATLFVHNIESTEDLCLRFDTAIRNKFFHWVKDETIEGWIEQIQPDIVKSIKNQVDETKAEWKVAKSSVSILLPEKRKRMLGLKLNQESLRHLEVSKLESIMVSHAITSTTRPTKFDWRNVDGKNWTTPIKNQGSCGSCVAFGVLGAMESLQKIHVCKSHTFTPDLSEAHLFFCGGAKCENGWYSTSGAEYLKTTGVPPESFFRYPLLTSLFGSNASCKSRSGWKNAVAKITGYNRISDVDMMKQAIADHGPLVAGMEVYSDFSWYGGGIYSHAWGDKEGNHCITVVGYDDTEKYWICKNSWGSLWGIWEGGWFKIAYGECSIEAYGMVKMVPLGGNPSLKKWDIIQFIYPAEGYCIAVPYAHPFKNPVPYEHPFNTVSGGYGINPALHWETLGSKYRHIMFSQIGSGAIAVGGYIALFGTIGGIIGAAAGHPLIGGIVGVSIGIGVSLTWPAIQDLLFDEDANIWAWTGRKFEKWLADNGLGLLIIAGIIGVAGAIIGGIIGGIAGPAAAGAIIATAWADKGYLKLGPVELFKGPNYK